MGEHRKFLGGVVMADKGTARDNAIEMVAERLWHAGLPGTMSKQRVFASSLLDVAHEQGHIYWADEFEQVQGSVWFGVNNTAYASGRIGGVPVFRRVGRDDIARRPPAEGAFTQEGTQ